MRIFAAGLCVTAFIAFAAFLLFVGSLYAHREILGTLLAGAAIAGPLFGTIAATQQSRWNPLAIGSALGCLVLLVLFVLLGE